MKTNNKTDNSKLFWGVFLLLFIFGMIFLSTLFLFGKSEYLTLGVVAQLMILGNLFLWRYSTRWQKLLRRPLVLFFIYLLKVMLFIAILAISSNFLL